MREYEIVAKETTSGTFYVRANSEEEALAKFEDMTIDGGYRDLMEDVEDFSVNVVAHRVLDGDEIETAYVPDMDMTVIVKYTYRNGAAVAEQIVGFYHGEPNDHDTEYYTGKGTVATMF